MSSDPLIFFKPGYKAVQTFLGALGFQPEQLAKGFLTQEEVERANFSPSAIQEFARTCTVARPGKNPQTYLDEEEAQYGLQVLEALQEYKLGTEDPMATLRRLTNGCWKGREDVLYNISLLENRHYWPTNYPQHTFMNSCPFSTQMPYRHQFFKTHQLPYSVQQATKAVVGFFSRKDIHPNGSGVLVHYKGHTLLLTAKHVVTDREIPLYYKTDGGEMVAMKEEDFLWLDTRKFSIDFAILKVPASLSSDLHPAQLNLKAPVETRGPFFLMGYAAQDQRLGSGLRISVCKEFSTSGKFSWFLDHTCESRRGMSGGPLVTEKGEVMGVTISATTRWEYSIGATAINLNASDVVNALDEAVSKIK